MAHILVVDTDKTSDAIMKIILSCPKHQVTIMDNGVEALLYTKKALPDLIIIDSEIKKMSAKDFIQYIITDPETFYIPVLVLSSFPSKNTVLNLLNAGAIDFMSKNEINPSVLTRRINNILAKNGDINYKSIEHKIFDVSSKTEEEIFASVNEAVSTSNTVNIKAASNNVNHTYNNSHATNNRSSYSNSYLEDNSSYNKIISPAAIERKVSKIAEIKSLPFVAMELMQLTSSPDSDLSQIAQIIELDPALTAKVLRLANSAYYRRSKAKIYNLAESVRNIGFNGIKELVLGVSVIDSLNKGSQESRLTKLRIWYHSILCGVIAKEIALLCKFFDPELCFVAGILHDVGAAVLDDQVNKEYSIVLEAAKAGDMSLKEVEEQLLGITHDEVGNRILTSWGFPLEMTFPIAHHHRSFSDILRMKSDYKKLTLIIKVADCLAKILGEGLIENELLEEIPLQVLHTLGVSQNDLTTIFSRSINVVSDLVQILLLHIDQNDICKCSRMTEFRKLKPNKIALHDTKCQNFDVLASVFKLSNSEVFVKHDITSGLDKQYTDALVITISNSMDLKEVVKNFHVNKPQMDPNTCICVIAPENVLAENKELVNYTKNFLYLIKPKTMQEALLLINKINARIELQNKNKQNLFEQKISFSNSKVLSASMKFKQKL